MDVYIGFGLLSAGIIVLIFMVLDSWMKNKTAKMAERSYLDHGKSLEDPEFTLQSESKNASRASGVRYTAYEEAADSLSRPSALAEFCEQPSFGSASSAANQEPALFIEEASSFSAQADNILETVEIQPEPVRREKTASNPANLLVLSVMAKRNGCFESYDLLQAISAAGMQYGEMNIFHYYQSTAVGKLTLFSLVSANNPGEFDLNNIGDFSCPGLMLFMDISQVPDAQYAFKLMLETAERLAEDLDGHLRADPMTPWSEKIAWQYHQKIMRHKIAPPSVAYEV